MIDLIWGIGGMALLLLIAFIASSDRSAINWRTVGGALALQVSFAVLVLYWSVGQTALNKLSSGVQAVIDSTNEGIGFVFGPLIPEEGSIFALQVLPVIIFFASLTAVLYHLGILQFVVEKLGKGLGRLLGTERAESVNATANIFVGQTEAPLVIKPYVDGLSRSGLFAVMVGGLSTVAGSVLVGYSLLGAPLEYLIAASFMAAPGALLMAKIIIPETDLAAVQRERELVDSSAAAARRRGRRSSSGGTTSDTGESVPVDDVESEAEAAEEAQGSRHRNVIDAAANGAGEGLRLAATIGAMLIAFISLIALANLLLGVVGGWFGNGDLTFQEILGYVFAPLMTAIGIPWNEAFDAGSFVGQKVIVNEFVAFADFAPQIGDYSEKSAAVITFAITGFANLGSLGILLGGLGGIAPERRPDIASLGLRAIFAATLANLMSAAIAGILIG
ncbi:hypothetical protein KLP28_13865 [Nocardioidaceae bacterium]|nr:hypothetical protein KLP28_13865 [Nocardioidaceae bacterium]